MSYFDGAEKARERSIREMQALKSQQAADYNYLRAKQMADREDAEFKRSEETRNWLMQQSDPGNIPASEYMKRGMFKEASAARGAEQERQAKTYQALAKIAEGVTDQATYDSALDAASKLYGTLPANFPKVYNKGFVDNLRGMLMERTTPKWGIKSYKDDQGNEVTVGFDPSTGAMQPISKTPRNLLFAPQQPDRAAAREEARDKRKDADYDRETTEARTKLRGMTRDQVMGAIHKTIQNEVGQSAPNPNYDPLIEDAYMKANRRLKSSNDKDFDAHAAANSIRAASKNRPLTREEAAKQANDLASKGFSPAEIRQIFINAGVSPKK